MKRIDFTIEEIENIVPNTYAASIIISNRAKAIRENIGDVDDDLRKLKPTVAAMREFMTGKIKFEPFELKKINEGD